MPDYEPNMVLSTQEFRVVGSSPIRPDGADKVTGRARFGIDASLPGMLQAKILRSPHAHARIKSIDTSRAKALPGVHAVITAADFPEVSGRVADLAEGSIHNMGFLSRNIMAREKALYKGHAIAAVAATNLHVAAEALALIDVDYEVLTPVMNAQEAMKGGAPLLHERLASLTNPAVRPGGVMDDDDPSEGSNIANHFEFRLGDVAKGFAEADVIVQHETSTSAVHQGYIEPHTGTAMWQSDGSLIIWSSTQGHFTVREMTGRLLGIPASKIKVIPMEVGGGFGAKGIIYVEPVATVLARLTGRPVRVTMTRTEVFESSGPTSASHIKVKLGATKEGKLVAAEAELIYEAGAFPGSPAVPGCVCMMSAYDIPNARLEGYDVVVNTPKSAAYRAPGSPVSAFAMETAIDKLCEKLGMDPLDFRLLNSSKEGTRQVTGPVFPRIGFIETLQAAKAHPHYSAPLEGPNRGRGVASGYWRNNTGPSSVLVIVNSDGTVSLVEGSVDLSGTRTTLAQQLAEVLGIQVEDVRPAVADTDSIGFTSNSGGSGATFKTGWAVHHAGEDVKRQMIQRAAKVWEIPEEDVEYRDGVLRHKSDPELQLTFKQVAGRQNGTGGPITGRAGVNPGGVGPALATHIVDVEVDPETGKVSILRYTALQDVGKAVHPDIVAGQIQGGATQGIGWALNEEYYFNNQGAMMNSTFLDYRMPTSLDLPMIDTVIVEVANPGHPYGVRGVGEVPIVPPMAAISNAIHRAVGVRMNRLPMSPGRVLEALWEK
ncbi:MAG: xanthine dehydrogenase family protein molybdopterin-binding subunit [Dehalococcoidia bacterium]|nr:xanthine dehydrogenase family protein molybdopterin-binding subunit [Dehalococcoidia bacterium]MDP6228551.1 xanthine dehydrogenase family protein molybdopterin-binding subunit [Dehalococcoidia bacterium]MDP7083277.1 xanthine dehydrogenase family protein molybdopterin-binding subunit [Dehalococcoidia bacterium]MDP7200697.1 xanthine dehydrogenase family protein molybdopterin-binding subunit [Dehalococcoidia bacterium]MDP7509413.1 xanthine dehydrogenase family protein molybdopterin-binding subu